MTDGKDTRLTIRIPSALLDAAREKAQAEDITISQYVRRCLMQWVGMLPADSYVKEKKTPEQE